MPDFIRGTFLGLSVRGYNSSIGWGIGQPSTLTVQLAQDDKNGDSLTVTTDSYGTPVYFQHGNFKFGGLLQKLEQSNGPDGFPVWTVTCVDPREILEGAQLILGGYTGNTGSVANLYNPFGYWEDPTIGGFGASQWNEAGMPWNMVMAALADMTSTPDGTPYGGPLSFRGFTYSLDLSQLPTPPDFYRVGGNYVGLIEAIAQLCEDGGFDFVVELAGMTIRVRTVARLNQPPLGTISAIVNSNFGQTVARSTSGVEVRNEVTSSFLIGGEVCVLNMNNSLQSFWGLDANGLPLTTNAIVYLWIPVWVPTLQRNPPQRRPVEQLVAKKPADIFIGIAGKWTWNQLPDSYEQFNLNSSPIVDILASVVYQCSTLELRCAKSNYDTWAMYMAHFRQDILNQAGLIPIIQNMGNPGMIPLRPNVINDGPAAAGQAILTDAWIRCMRFYEFVRAYAEEYMGKKFLCGVPFLLRKQDPDTLLITSSYDVCDGGYLPEGSQPLGLSEFNEDIFMLQDGRFRAFAMYNNILGADLQAVSPQGSVIQPGAKGTSLYVPAQVDPNIVLNPTPMVVVTLQGALTDEPVDAVGGAEIMSAVFQMDPGQAQNVFKNSFIRTKIAPATRTPDAAAVPLKSNTQTYGPWFIAGPPGKVKFEQDTSLTPWNYGGYPLLDDAGNARVLQAITNMQLCEAGSIEMAGSPSCSLGDVMQSGGPNLTDINVQIGQGGATTTYRFATYTPRFGLGSKQAIERAKKMALAQVELRRSLRAAVRESNARAQSYATATINGGFMRNAPPAWNRGSPHDVIVCFSQTDSVNGDTRTWPQISTYEEAITLANGGTNDYLSTSIMSLAGLLRPFATQPNSGNNVMSCYSFPQIYGSGHTPPIPCQQSLDPWKDRNDIEVYAFGTTYAGLHAYRLPASTGVFARPVALRGPLVVSGWGYDIYGSRVPNSGDPTTWRADTLRRQDLHFTGPVDLRWDPNRGVWTSNGFVKGTLPNAIAGGGSGVLVSDPFGQNYVVWNYFTPTIQPGKAAAHYDPNDNKWWVTVADCAA